MTRYAIEMLMEAPSQIIKYILIEGDPLPRFISTNQNSIILPKETLLFDTYKFAQATMLPYMTQYDRAYFKIIQADAIDNWTEDYVTREGVKDTITVRNFTFENMSKLFKDLNLNETEMQSIIVTKIVQIAINLVKE